ncbi:MAG: DUF5597 domain-containing protein [Anaerolineae bacterium]|jgi:hypothetical protein|nr:DUF5597 domain-containing protein [Chloroflexota bacterium]
MSSICRPFTVQGKPFFPLGGQSRNSSGYNRAEAETAFKALKLLHGNTLEIPVYWEQVEPEEGTFDWASVDTLLAMARENDVHLVLLWFGTWKNGCMEYAPAWVKRDPERFWRVINPYGNRVWVLSSHCEATRQADEKAFCALLAHLKEQDAQQQTVIAVQIENEPGILGSDRDYGEAAEAMFQSPVPEGVLGLLQGLSSGGIWEAWQEAGGRQAGNWPEVLGARAGELMTAYSIARYIDSLAEAGRAVYDLPLYVNVWLGEAGWRAPGGTYPSGGAVSFALDLWKWATPHIDLIAPDIYIADADGYRAICEAYARPDNPLFVPESAPGSSNAWHMFHAIANTSAIGYHFFAIEHLVGPDGGVNPPAADIVGSFHAVASAIPLLLRYQGTDRIHAVMQLEGQGDQYLDLDGWTGVVRFGYGGVSYAGMDWRHTAADRALFQAPKAPRGRGLIFQESEDTFYLVGAAYRLGLRRKGPASQTMDPTQGDFLRERQAPFISIDEGHFEGDTFVVDRRRNGDERDNGIWVEPDVQVVRVIFAK